MSTQAPALFATATGKTAGLVANYITYLSGAVVPAALGSRADLGVLLTPRAGNRPPTLGHWGLDNGKFHAFDKPAVSFEERRFFAILDRELPRNTDGCMFAVVPDVVYNGEATLEEWPKWQARMADYGVPLAFAAQDGHENMIDQLPWDQLDVLFIGGSSCQCRKCAPNGPGLVAHDPTGGWKLDPARAGKVIDAGLARGKRVHLARVNSGGRLAKAQMLGAHSADGMYLSRNGGQAGLDKVTSWLATCNASIELAFLADDVVTL